ncbi:Ubiquitin carboxyl-terminal hydrolase 22 [Gracilariopsis chorda]|uniref:Ubiquitin carboxyl-terminal hydrolase n=1 Tax=Gracilariopsis chorda TaxID=448386 RepID=A0A2V3J6J8_9FLOR|nr:Ubiquitin carboxyl-terminal hydrolase 22 [Gracilariopsis chorda]|eukprot:PXF49933.1 Ubiquitin carboxyl-terminal hydrolase 22 [Gracilariopsis chorda]
MRIFCPHLSSVCNPEGLRRVSRAAESLFTAAHRPLTDIGQGSVPKCLHPDCVFSAAQDVYVCLHCVYMSCFNLDDTGSTSSGIEDQNDPKDPSPEYKTHLYQHFRSAGHFLHLSVEHQQMFCAECNDYVFNRYLDGAIGLQKYMARAQRRRFTSSISPLDSPVQTSPVFQLSNIKDRSKKRRLLTPSEWTPSDIELNKITLNSVMFAQPRKGIRPPAGLFNLGNSCYMNSVLQAFLNAPPLRRFFLADEHRPYCKKATKSDCLACAIDKLVCDSTFTIEAVPPREKNGHSSASLQVPFLVPQSVLDIMWRNAENLATYAQHDAHEFLIAALNVLNAHCRHEKFPDKSRETGESSKNDSSTTNKRGSSDPRRKLNPTSPVTNVRADPGGGFSKASLVSIHSTTSIVQNLFSGTLQSDVICRVCGNRSPTLERFYDISLDVDKVIKPASTRRSRAQSPAVDIQTSGNYPVQKKSAGSSADRSGSRQKVDHKGESAQSLHQSSGSRSSYDANNSSCEGEGDKDGDIANTLHECLTRFTEPELLDTSSKMHCMNCNMWQESMKQMSIRTLPPIICFHFKRFEQSFASIRRSEMVKIDTPVEFPADGLDLSLFQTSEVLRRRHEERAPQATTTALSDTLNVSAQRRDHPSDEKANARVRSNNDAVYDLFAVVNHSGRIDSGHYTSIIRRQGEWFRCDDEKVSRIAQVGEIVRSEEAYLVFYVQRFPNVQF